MLDTKGLKIELTCLACPEQYDVFHGNSKVGYLRLRHGRFSVDCPIGNEIWSAYPKGDGFFEDDEREYFLQSAIDMIKKHINSTNKKKKKKKT